MQPNDVELVRVYTREPGQVISDITIETGKDFEVVLEAEAGSAIHGTGGGYTFAITIRDLTRCECIYSDQLQGLFGDTNWPQLRTQVVFTVIASFPGIPLEDHIMQVEAVLLTGGVGAVAPDASFCTSPKFVFHAP